MKKDNFDNANINSGKDKPFEIRSFDDLVFEHRNRDYGAYQLRTRYFRILLTSVIISSLLAAVAVLIPFLLRPVNERVLVAGGGGYPGAVRMESLPPPPEQIFVPPAPPRPARERPPETVQYIPPVIVDTLVPVEATQIITDLAIDSRDNYLPDGSGSGFGDSLFPGGDGFGADEPLFQVEFMPTFRGGDLNKFREWVTKRTHYPAEAIEKKIKGTVFLTFVVERDGSVSNVTVIKGVHPILDEEAVKAISDSPKWSPGLQRGLPVRVRFQIPLTFF